jgi:hypothetical protein
VHLWIIVDGAGAPAQPMPARIIPTRREFS